MILSAMIVLLSYFLMWFGSRLIGVYAVTVGLLMFAALLGFSFSYFQQIIQATYRGENKPPLWEIQEVSLLGWIHAVTPVIFSLFLSLLVTCTLIFLISVIFNSTFMEYFNRLFKAIFPFILAFIFPVNFLSYSLFKDLNVLKIFNEINHKSILLLFSLFPLFFIFITGVLFIPLPGEFLNLILKWVIIFYLLQVFSFSLGQISKNKFFHQVFE